MPNTPPPPEDDETSASDLQDTSLDTPRSSSPFSASRAARIRRSGGPRISGAIPGRDPLPGSEPPPPAAPDATTATASSPRARRPSGPRVRRPGGPRTYAHLLAGLSYLVPPIVPAVILLRPTSHPFARFHALQALALFIAVATFSFLLSLFTPTNIILGILYIILVLVIVVLLLLWIAAAIAAFEGFAVGLPVLDRRLPRTDGLEEDLTMRSANPRAMLEVAIAIGASVVLLILTVWLPLGGWFGKLSRQNLAALGLVSGLPAWMVVSSLLFSLIFAAFGLTTLAVLVLGLRKGKFLPSLASGAAVAGSALTAAGTGLLIADTLQRSLYSKLEQQYQNMVSNTPLPKNTLDTNVFVQTISKGRAALSAIDPTQHSLLIPGAVLLLIGIGILLFLLSQLYYKK